MESNDKKIERWPTFYKWFPYETMSGNVYSRSRLTSFSRGMDLLIHHRPLWGFAQKLVITNQLLRASMMSSAGLHLDQAQFLYCKNVTFIGALTERNVIQFVAAM